MIKAAFLVWWDGKTITDMQPNDTKAWYEIDDRPPDMPITLWLEKYCTHITLPSGEYAVNDHEWFWMRKTKYLLGDEQYIKDTIGENIRDQLRDQPPGLYVTLYDSDDLWEAETNLIMKTPKGDGKCSLIGIAE